MDALIVGIAWVLVATLGVWLWRWQAPTLHKRLGSLSLLVPGDPPRPRRGLDHSPHLKGRIVVTWETSKRVPAGIHITGHVTTLADAAEKGIVLLDSAGKVRGKKRGVAIELPEGTRYEDVFLVRPTKFVQSGIDADTGVPLGRSHPQPWPNTRRG